MDETTITAVLDFWFAELEPEQWWKSDPALDSEIVKRFRELHGAAVSCELDRWRETAPGRLAEIIVIDQFSRNIYRGQPQAFLFDPLALGLAQEAIRAGAHTALEPQQRAFLYMPFMHSESKLIHERAVALFSEPGLESNLEFEHKHKRIIERFGRYPHRNAVLGRRSTAAELAFLEEPGSSF